MVKTAYKVRLDDGMEVGPLDGEMIRSWFQQGMVNPETLLKPQGSKRWVRLADTFEVDDWGEPLEKLRTKKVALCHCIVV